MFSNQVRIGESYAVRRSYGRGRAVVQGPGTKDTWSNKYVFPVLFPDARPGAKNEDRIASPDILHVWGMEDQKHWEESQKTEAQISALEDGLIAAGFRPDTIRYISQGDLLLTFRGSNATEVIEALIKFGELRWPELLKEKQLEAGDDA